MRALLAALTLLLGLVAVADQAAAAAHLAAGRTATASSFTDLYRAANVTDGDQATYWESENGRFPQWVQVDLGGAAALTGLTLKLPDGWPARTQTITVQGSADGTTFTTLKAQATYHFAPSATVTLSGTARYV